MEHTKPFVLDSNTVGIVDLPAGSATTAAALATGKNRTAVIFFNTFEAHRSGTNRLHTLAARRLAEIGYISARFDNTPVLPTHDSESNFTAIENLQKTIALLKIDYNVQKIVVCATRADEQLLAFSAQTSDIRGLFLIDAPGFRTLRFHTLHTLLQKPRQWLSKQWWRDYLYGEEKSELEKTGLMKADKFRYRVWSLVENHCRIHFLFTGGAVSYYNHPEQLATMCTGLTQVKSLEAVDTRASMQPAGSNDSASSDNAVASKHYITTSFLPLADHRLIHLSERTRVLQHMVRWITLEFPQVVQFRDDDADKQESSNRKAA